MREQTIYTSEKHSLTEENKTYFYSEKKNSIVQTYVWMIPSIRFFRPPLHYYMLLT